MVLYLVTGGRLLEKTVVAPAFWDLSLEPALEEEFWKDCPRQKRVRRLLLQLFRPLFAKSDLAIFLAVEFSGIDFRESPLISLSVLKLLSGNVRPLIRAWFKLFSQCGVVFERQSTFGFST